MKQLLDFIPLIVFFVCYKLYGIFTATAALIATTALVLLISYILYKKIEKMMLITFAMVLFFGTLTIVFHSDVFIKWKVTIIYALFALTLLISQIFFKKILIKNLLNKEISLSDRVWQHINIAWAIFFIFCSLLNIYIAFWLPQATWVNFKVFGLTILTVVFTIINIAYIYKNLSNHNDE